ncbi:MAG: 4-hydroxybutyrate dehydrogenase [Christensenellales bacterium]|jgi:4-hydroxybutyrate dehydrogenase
MRELIVKPQIHHFETVSQFAQEFELTAEDLIFTEIFIDKTFIAPLNLPCPVICRDSYGVGEPTDALMDKIIGDAQGMGVKRIIAVGGGTVIDIAKVMVLKNALPTAKLFQKQIPIEKEKQLVIIPTTCGTGSEMTNLSIAHIEEKGTKLGIGDDDMYADHAVLIPELVAGLPYKFFVFSAIDAMVHATESFLSPKANAFTEMYSLKAAEMILSGFGEMIKNGPDARKPLTGQFLTASCMAGIAFGNAGVGAVHALAYPLGGNYHVPHGETNYQFFTEVFNVYLAEKKDSKIDMLADAIAAQLEKIGIASTKTDVFQKLEGMLGQLLPLVSLREYGMKEEEIDIFAQSVMDNQQRLLVNSYIPFTLEHAKKIYRNRY